jgi:hypothetical protein
MGISLCCSYFRAPPASWGAHPFASLYAAVIVFFFYNFFFTQPYLRLHITDPAERALAIVLAVSGPASALLGMLSGGSDEGPRSNTASNPGAREAPRERLRAVAPEATQKPRRFSARASNVSSREDSSTSHPGTKPGGLALRAGSRGPWLGLGFRGRGSGHVIALGA